MKNNLILIGMPGSGKSTTGIILAKTLALEFVDTDILIQKREGKTLQDIIDNDGHLGLRRIEEEVLLDVDLQNHVIATGGSAAYSESAMEYLGEKGLILFLHADLKTLRQRINNYETRGLAKRKDQSFDDLFHERHLLYKKYADHTIETTGHSQDEVCQYIYNTLIRTGTPQFLP